MNVWVIYNPIARGEKARFLRARLETLRGACHLLPTQRAGHATRLAIEAIQHGAECVVAVGGDGTIHEVVNGLMSSEETPPSMLGVIPSGTANVFALEHGIPWNFDDAWQLIRSGLSKKIDVIRAEHHVENRLSRAYIVQLAGAGFDAHTLRFVSWKLKKKTGKLAYWIAGFRALEGKHPRLECNFNNESHSCALALIGNGHYYGGKHILFPNAKPDDGLMDVTLFRRITPLMVLRTCWQVICKHGFCLDYDDCFQTKMACLTPISGRDCDFQLEGEWSGTLPVRLTLLPGALKIIAKNN